jgi:hypothetical protein
MKIHSAEGVSVAKYHLKAKIISSCRRRNKSEEAKSQRESVRGSGDAGESWAAAGGSAARRRRSGRRSASAEKYRKRAKRKREAAAGGLKETHAKKKEENSS